MSAVTDKSTLINYWEARLTQLLQTRNNLEQEDLEYVVEKVITLRDLRLQSCVTELIGWGDEERSELETFAAIAIEMMKLAKPSMIREASRNVELRFHLKRKIT